MAFIRSLVSNFLSSFGKLVRSRRSSGNISLLKTDYKKLHLNSIVRMPGFLQFDNPGDFQLMLREDLFRIGGFDESMILGWNVDANICKRMTLLRGQGKSLEDKLLGFHCNHTLKRTIVHHPFWKKNCWKKYVSRKDLEPILNQPSWGLANEELEQILLSEKKPYLHLEFLKSVLSESPSQDYEFLLDGASYNKLTPSTPRVLSFLVDQITYLPETATIAYIGYNEKIPTLLKQYLSLTSSQKKVLCLTGQTDLSHAFVLIFDFGIDSSQDLKRENLRNVLAAFFKALKKTKSSKERKKFIGVNINHTSLKTIFSSSLTLSLNSYATGITCGFSKPFKIELTKKLFYPLFIAFTSAALSIFQNSPNFS